MSEEWIVYRDSPKDFERPMKLPEGEYLFIHKEKAEGEIGVLVNAKDWIKLCYEELVQATSQDIRALKQRAEKAERERGEADEALAACQSQAAGRIRELKAKIRRLVSPEVEAHVAAQDSKARAYLVYAILDEFPQLVGNWKTGAAKRILDRVVYQTTRPATGEGRKIDEPLEWDPEGLGDVEGQVLSKMVDRWKNEDEADHSEVEQHLRDNLQELYTSEPAAPSEQEGEADGEVCLYGTALRNLQGWLNDAFSDLSMDDEGGLEALENIARTLGFPTDSLPLPTHPALQDPQRPGWLGVTREEAFAALRASQEREQRPTPWLPEEVVKDELCAVLDRIGWPDDPQARSEAENRLVEAADDAAKRLEEAFRARLSTERPRITWEQFEQAKEAYIKAGGVMSSNINKTLGAVFNALGLTIEDSSDE